MKIQDLDFTPIVVDIETTGLDSDRHFAIEVAWWNLLTDESGRFIPPHNQLRALETASEEALAINGYRERILGRPQDTSGAAASELRAQLIDNTLSGSNPRFDEDFLEQLMPRCWHYKLWDLSAYAMGVLGLNYQPGLFGVCELLNIEAPDHTAEGDVTATGRCFIELLSRTREES